VDDVFVILHLMYINCTQWCLAVEFCALPSTCVSARTSCEVLIVADVYSDDQAQCCQPSTEHVNSVSAKCDSSCNSSVEKVKRLKLVQRGQIHRYNEVYHSVLYEHYILHALMFTVQSVICL